MIDTSDIVNLYGEDVNVYLSTPYSHQDQFIMKRRYHAINRMAWKLMQQGLTVFSPISHSHSIEATANDRKGHEFWMNQDLPYLTDGWADLLLVFKAKGWRESVGVDAEMEVAGTNGIEMEWISPLEVVTIVGASGKKRSGKDTMGDVFTDYGFEKFALADPIKRIGADVFHLSDEQLRGDRKETMDTQWGKTPREIMQLIGTEGFREAFGEDVWVDSLLQRLRLELPAKAFVTDVRFPNEVLGLQQRGGADIHRIDASARLEDSGDGHASETALDDFPSEKYTRVVGNNGTLAEFENKCHSLAKNYM